MSAFSPRHPLSRRILGASLYLALLAFLLPAVANAAPSGKQDRKSPSAVGSLKQLKRANGCLVDRSQPHGSCRPARALKGPGPFMGSRAIDVSPDGRSVYVASSRSDAIAIFRRSERTGKLRQKKGSAGCIAARGASRCATAIGLDGPNSVAVSPDGRTVYATSRATGSVVALRRQPITGALTQLKDGGCFSSVEIPGCTVGLGLLGADVVTVSPDAENVYVGSFFGSAVATFDRSSAGGLAQPTDGTGCLAEAPADGCTTGLALGSPEGMAISGDGTSVYVASAASNAVVVLSRDPSTGVLTQATDGTGCIVDAPLTGCTTGLQLGGANAVAVSADDSDVYVTSLLSQSVTSFTRSGSGELTQKAGTTGCLVNLRAVGCSFGRAVDAPEGIAVAPDGTSVYVAAFGSNAIDILDRDPSTGEVAQKARRAGCVSKRGLADCHPARRMKNVSSIALSPDGRHLYSTAFGSDAVGVFRRKISKKASRNLEEQRQTVRTG